MKYEYEYQYEYDVKHEKEHIALQDQSDPIRRNYLLPTRPTPRNDNRTGWNRI